MNETLDKIIKEKFLLYLSIIDYDIISKFDKSKIEILISENERILKKLCNEKQINIDIEFWSFLDCLKSEISMLFYKNKHRTNFIYNCRKLNIPFNISDTIYNKIKVKDIRINHLTSFIEENFNVSRETTIRYISDMINNDLIIVYDNNKKTSNDDSSLQLHLT